MYKMPEFTESDQAAVFDFIKANTFITLIGNDGTTSVATQVPVLVSETEGKLHIRGHIMRKTDHHMAFEKNPEILALFTGPQCYVSASWYAERGIGSTWNYMAVHIRGTIKFMDTTGTTALIVDLTNKYEGGRENPELVEKMAPEYVSGMVKGIAGFEIEIHSIEPIFKLSQNRTDISYKNIVGQLLATGNYEEEQIAGEMIKRRPALFEPLG